MKDENESAQTGHANGTENTPQSISGIFPNATGRSKKKKVKKFGSKRSGACVTISTTHDKSGPKHLIYWYEPGIKERQTEGTRDLDYAEGRAKEIHEMLKKGVVEVGRIDHKTLVLVREAEEIMGGSGFTVAQAARRFMALVAQTPPDTTLETIFARGLLNTEKPVKNKWTIEQCKEPMFQHFLKVLKLEKGTLRNYTRTIKVLGNILAGRPVCAITKTIIQQVVNRYVGLPTYASELGRCRQIMKWCQENECFPDGVTLPSHEISKATVIQSSDTPEIFTVKACLKHVRYAQERLFPANVLLACNLFRPCEVYRMTFEQLFANWDSGWIWVPDKVAKKVRGRYAARWTPILPLTRFLLEKYRNKKGFIFPGPKKYTHADFSGYCCRFRKSIYVRTVGDGLRKSCISMHAALGVDLHRVSKWAGNSPDTIRQYYEDPATTESFIRVLTAGLMRCELTDPAVDKALATIMATSTRPKVKPPKHILVPYRRE